MIHKHEPVTEEAMDHVSPDMTICETLRKAYHKSSDADVRYDLRVATSMAKSMSAKLESYHRNWRSGFYETNPIYPFRKKPIDVLFLCYDDNANTGYRFWKCAQYLGLNSIMFKGKSHAFGYPEQAPIHPSLSNAPICNAPVTVMAPGLESLMQSATVIHLIASTFPMVAFDWSKANVVVQHGGTVYRQHPEACNALFNRIAKKTVIQMPDLLGLGANNEEWIYYPVDTVLIQPDFSDKGPCPVVGHFPSNQSVKGSDQIIDAIASVANGGAKLIPNIDQRKTHWAGNLERMSKCDIYIEALSPEQNGKAYGEWGNQALEAAALGCAVITNCHSIDKYRNEFGEFGPEVANTPEELSKKLKSLVTDKSQLNKVKRRCRKWAEDNHSIPVTATRLWDKVYKAFF